MTMYIDEPGMYTSTTRTEYGLSFREELVLAITKGVVSRNSDCWKGGNRIATAEAIVDLADMIYLETQDPYEESEEPEVASA